MPTLKSTQAAHTLRQLAILAAPTILMLAWMKLAQYRADAGIFNADGLIWNTPAGAVRASVQSSRSPKDVESEIIRLTIVDGSGRSLFQDDVSVDWDLWGWGFVKAMQMDADPELEVVSMNYSDLKRIARKEQVYHAYILDLSSGQVQRSADFSHAPEGFYRLLGNWESAYKSMTEGFIIFLFCVPTMVGFVIVALRAGYQKLRGQAPA